MRKFNVKVNGQSYEVEIEEVVTKDEKIASTPSKPASKETLNQTENEVIAAPMPGKILDIKVGVGDLVKEGDVLLTLEAMKMENEIMASKSGKIKAVYIHKNASVNSGDILIEIE